MIIVRDNINNVDEFNLLYNLVGWGSYDKNISKKELDNTYYSVSVYDDDKIIGYGRYEEDGVEYNIEVNKDTLNDLDSKAWVELDEGDEVLEFTMQYDYVE